DVREAADSYTAEERTSIGVYERANPSVVHIMTSSAPRESLFFFEPPARGSGSGSVLDRAGHILTNYHVVEGADEIAVTFSDGFRATAALVGIDSVSDVAVLKVTAPPSRLTPLPLGDSTNLRVGQRVYAIGNPFGWEGTMSEGIISSLNRTLPSRQHRTIKSMIQIDAALNKGNSGGPLLDSRGRMIGMNTAIASQSGDSAGIGFAIPANTLGRIVPQLIESGRVARPSIGISAVVPRDGGLLVAIVTLGGPADRAGIQGFELVTETLRRGGSLYQVRRIDRESADLIVAVEGKDVKTLDDFLSQVESRQPGDRLRLTIRRDGKEQQVVVALEKAS
ncbi:MAG: trypsin-like peptidase domain-containing protein, partial [Pirellulaceae bacterium]|nr:trypsin-like peptidase domain-containing protein [Pirellulaceae bacterium]